MNRRFFPLLISVVIGLFITYSAIGQNPLLQPFPIDPAVRIGKLDNGLTYIIRHNAKPEKRAHFYIAQRVGSMQEEDAQSGLAHFLEHMAFNGTTNFPGKSLTTYLEKNGIQFGENLNAYTGFDETVYQIMNAPTTRQGMVDSCLLILHDWSNEISLLGEEIDKERGVIQEEWRSRDNGSMRAFTKILAKAFPTHRYGKRIPIGSMDVVLNFSHQTLRDYYNRWYRPDLQGIIVVGDIDVDAVENKIKELFSSIKLNPKNPPREYLHVPDNQSPISIVATDPEVKGTSISVFYLADAPTIQEKATPAYMLQQFIYGMIARMMDKRFEERLQQPNVPYRDASLSYGNYIVAMTKDALTLNVFAKDGKYKEAMMAAVADFKQAVQYGFTDSEFKIAKSELLKYYDDKLKEKETVKNEEYIERYTRYFTTGGYIPGIELETQWIHAIADQVNVKVVNAALNRAVTVAPNNRTISLMAPEKPEFKYPTEEELLKDYQEAMAQEVKPYVPKAVAEKLMDKLPQGGTIVEEKKDQPFGSTLILLNNGIKVYLQPLQHEKNTVFLNAFSQGGRSLIDHTKDNISIRAINDFATVGGLANFSPLDLDKVLAGKTAHVFTEVGDIQERVSGKSSTDDIETMLQLVYLNFTDLRVDTALFQSHQQQVIASLEASKIQPLSPVLRDSLPNLLFPGEIRAKPLTIDEVKAVDYSKIVELYKERFADASDFTFILTGDFNPETVKPLVAQYLGSLPVLGKPEKADISKVYGYGEKGRTTKIDVEMTTPTGIVFDAYVQTLPYDQHNRVLLGVLMDVLSQTFHESIREEEGGTYGVGVQTSISRYPAGEAHLEVQFMTSPKEAERLNGIVKTQLKEIAEKGVNIEFFNKTIQNKEKNFSEAQQTNAYWISALKTQLQYNEDTHAKYLDILHTITPDDLKTTVKSFLDNNNRYFEMIISGNPASKPDEAKTTPASKN